MYEMEKINQMVAMELPSIYLNWEKTNDSWKIVIDEELKRKGYYLAEESAGIRKYRREGRNDKGRTERISGTFGRSGRNKANP